MGMNELMNDEWMMNELWMNELEFHAFLTQIPLLHGFSWVGYEENV
jgi:hypothetical protein